MAVANGESAPVAIDLDVKPPENIVIPPAGVRAGIAKTADFVFRRGDVLLGSLKQRTANDPKSQVTFVQDDDPYNPYFLWYLEQLKAGHGPAAKSTAQAVPEKPKGPPEPAKFRFSGRMPNISAKDLEVLKLTALYTARVGENWLKELRNREANNFQFDFLRPQHSFFQFFRALVEQYKVLLEEDQTVEARIAELQENIKNRFYILERAKGRAEYIKYVSAQKEKEEKKAEDEKKEYASIDWHDFTVIATVLFDEADDAADLPPPALLNDLQSQSLEQKAAVSLSARRLEEALPDDSTYYNVSQHNTAYSVPPPNPAAPVAYPQYAPPPPPPQQQQDYAYTAAQRQREEEQARAQAEADTRARQQAATRGAPGRIVADYVPRAAKKANVAMVVCPNCKQQFSASEIDEHIRIELLDPRWKEQRDKAEQRYSTTINTADVASNLKRFASQRDDIYDGATGQPISAEEEARRKRAAISYDGQPDPAKDAARIQQMQSMNVQEQVRRIQEKHRH
ncbi:Pre-mRNA splicing factor PRP21 like protein-domain-containing protein [Boeremia exigua]|uniref:Pre-mRNA splicing factor PRP21 like protein-domain-containing protein n=1 Tax=Boeremia exigua TaxID=749465 RepID=UPI001E8EE544|nr:Pre-mRNA splicing factor PRP21 like protein-domain-containing protein [Boeremia exigua]KAH6620456.1 Pre-mRNA splicing factor PRP21 like protein-domain-containing protein [Boeremia exigua]